METVIITLPDGNARHYPRGVTGSAIAESISPRLAREALAVSVNEVTGDLSRPIDADASVHLLTWQDDAGKHAYWHSSSHLMAEAVEALFPGAKFGVGPAIEAGFYYDIDLGDHSLTIEDLAASSRRWSSCRSGIAPIGAR